MGYTLDNIISEYLIELGDQNKNRYARFYQLGVAYLREANIDSTGVVKTVELPINDNDTVDLPPDYMQYTVIGFCGRDGNIHSLGRNDKLCIASDCGDVPAQITSGFSVSNSTFGVSQSWRNGEFMGKVFGAGGGDNANGEFRIDIAKGQIQLGKLNAHNNSIILEYIADVDAINGDFQVHPYSIQTLKYWVFWRSIAMDRNRNANEKEMARRDYYNEERWRKRRYEQATISEWLSAFRSGNSAAVKF